MKWGIGASDQILRDSFTHASIISVLYMRIKICTEFT